MIRKHRTHSDSKPESSPASAGIFSIEAVAVGFACALGIYAAFSILGLGTGITTTELGALPPTDHNQSAAQFWWFSTAAVASLLGALATGAWANLRRGQSGAINPLVCWTATTLLFMVLIAHGSGGPEIAKSAAELSTQPSVSLR